MKSLFSRSALFAFLFTVTGMMFTVLKSNAQTSIDDITAMNDKYWTDYESYLKKAIAEKDNHKSAVILNQMVKELVPRADELNAKIAAWKKSHNQIDQQIHLMSVTQGNKHVAETVKCSMDVSLSMRSGQSEELHKAMKNMIDNLPVSKTTALM